MKFIRRAIQRGYQTGDRRELQGKLLSKSGGASPHQRYGKATVLNKMQHIVRYKFGKVRSQRLALMERKKSEPRKRLPEPSGSTRSWVNDEGMCQEPVTGTP